MLAWTPIIDTSTHGNEASFEFIVEKAPTISSFWIVTPQLALTVPSWPRRSWKNELVMGTDAYKNGNIVYLAHPARVGTPPRVVSPHWTLCCRIWRASCWVNAVSDGVLRPFSKGTHISFSSNLTANERSAYHGSGKQNASYWRQEAPSFEAVTTQGPIKFPEDYAGKWVILFSHPADFTPVCTTEFKTFGSMIDEFKALSILSWLGFRWTPSIPTLPGCGRSRSWSGTVRSTSM